MGKIKPFQTGRPRWITGGLALCLLLAINFQPAVITITMWLAETHGHAHQIEVHAGANHLDLRLSHHEAPGAMDQAHEGSIGFMAALCATHDHDGNDHVLHFILGETPDQIRQRNNCAPFAPQSGVVLANDLIMTASAAAITGPTFPTESPPPRSAGLLCLRTTVLLL